MECLHQIQPLNPSNSADYISFLAWSSEALCNILKFYKYLLLFLLRLPVDIWQIVSTSLMSSLGEQPALIMASRNSVTQKWKLSWAPKVSWKICKLQKSNSCPINCKHSTKWGSFQQFHKEDKLLMMSMEHKNLSMHVQNKHKKGRRLHCANYARNFHLYSCKIQITHRQLSADQVLSVKNALLRKITKL